jgi:hypothetical protein
MLLKFSRRCAFPDPDQSPIFRLVITSSPVLPPSIHLTQHYQTNSLAPMITLTLERIKFVVLLFSIMMLLKYLIRTRLKYLLTFISRHVSLTSNRCFDFFASDISFLKSLSPDLLCLLRHFSVGYFKPAAQNSYWHRTNEYHSGWNGHSWIRYSTTGYYSLNSSWLIAFIVNPIFVNHHNLIWSMR